MARSLVFLLLVACSSPAPPPVPVPVPVPVPDAAPVTVTDAASVPDAVPVSDAAPDTAPLVTIPEWGVQIAVPPTATHGPYDKVRDRYEVMLEHQRLARFELRNGPAPASLDKAIAPYTDDRAFVNHGSGVTAHGAMFILRSFEVRTGFRSGQGEHVHYYIDISRVTAWLPLDARRHIECTGYYEDGVDSASHPAIAALAKACLSMRVAP